MIINSIQSSAKEIKILEQDLSSSNFMSLFSTHLYFDALTNLTSYDQIHDQINRIHHEFNEQFNRLKQADVSIQLLMSRLATLISQNQENKSLLSARDTCKQLESKLLVIHNKLNIGATLDNAIKATSKLRKHLNIFDSDIYKIESALEKMNENEHAQKYEIPANKNQFTKSPAVSKLGLMGSAQTSTRSTPENIEERKQTSTPVNTPNS